MKRRELPLIIQGLAQPLRQESKAKIDNKTLRFMAKTQRMSILIEMSRSKSEV